MARVSEALQPLEGPARTLGRRNAFWLLAKRRSGRLEVLTTSLVDGRGVLPVFSFEEEANLYLRRGIPGGWQVWRTGPGELVSLLYGLCSKVELVALDPVSDVEADVVNKLVSLERKRFVNFLLHREASVRKAPYAPLVWTPKVHWGGASYFTHRRAERPLL